MVTPLHLTPPPEAAGERLDVWLARAVPGLTRSRVQALLAAGHIRVDGAPVRASLRVSPAQAVTVTIPAPEPVALVPEAIPLDLVYQDADIVVVNKPAGLVVHPAAGHARGTLVNALLYGCADLGAIGDEIRPGIVHRLDRDTSGLLVVAKHEAALHALARQFQERTVRKMYRALVWAAPRPPTGRIETLIGRHPTDRKRMSVRPSGGRNAITRYAVEESLGGVSLLRVEIETGRTHQIRVHCAHIGHPVVGDVQYGGRFARRPLPAPAPRQMLHAARLEVRHPVSGEPLCFEAPLPPDMATLLAALRTGETP